MNDDEGPTMARDHRREREREIAHDDSGEKRMAKYIRKDCRRRKLGPRKIRPRLPTEFDLKISRLRSGRNTAGSTNGDTEKLKHEKEESE